MLYIIHPALVVMIAAICGAIGMLLLFQRISTASRLVGLLLGAGAGTLGASAMMIPLNFCTFEAERTDADVLFGMGLIAIGVGLALMAGQWFARTFYSGRGLIPRADTRQGAFGHGISGVIGGLVLLSPTLIILALFLYYPMFETFRLSTQLARLGAPRTVAVCVDNFTRLFQDPGYQYSVFVSFSIAAAIIILALILSLLIATMAYLPIKGARIYRILLIWPYALSPVIAGIIFQLLFNPAAGVINYFMDLVFDFKVPWLLDRNIAPLTVIAAGVWNILGFNILFYIAGLQNVPKDLLESAAIDGANAFQRFFSITLPLLSPITFFLVVTNTTYAFFDTFGLIDFLTSGGPNNATSTMMYEVYITGVVSRNLGLAAAMSLVLFVIVIVVTIAQFRVSRDRVNYGA